MIVVLNVTSSFQLEGKECELRPVVWIQIMKYSHLKVIFQGIIVFKIVSTQSEMENSLESICQMFNL